MNHRQNITRIKVVHAALEELADDVIFVGGATVSIYADRPFNDARPTDDVDILVELLNYKGYAEIEQKLREKGFVNDMHSGVICRYIVKGIIVDVMPTSDEVLGFANLWYPEGYANSIEKTIEDDVVIKIFDPVYFLAAKIEAYKNRGENDGRFSSDFEDITFLLNKRNSIWNELEQSSDKLKEYLKVAFRELLREEYFDEWISCHIEFDEQRRVDFIIGMLQQFANDSLK